MPQAPKYLLLMLLTILLMMGLAVPVVHAADPCPVLRNQKASADVATRIAAWACEANQAWHRPFIDLEGKPQGVRTYEAEATPLANSIQAWQQVAIYWNDSGLLPRAYGRPGASECAYANTSRYPSPSCRAFIIDTPWSAVFVSWVMRRAGLPGFTGSPSHVDYVRDAYRFPADTAYRVHDPRSARPETGDLLCYVRVASRIYGYGDLAGLLSSPDGQGLGMHCDIVAGTIPGNRAYLVGGNVAQAVMLRMLRLAPNGYFADLPMRTPGDPPCTPDSPAGCDSNRQDWAVLLKLRPAVELATLPPPYVPPASQVLPSAPAQQCCVNCVVGSGIPRCPAGTSPPQSQLPPSPDPGKRLPTQAPPGTPPNQCCVTCTVGSGVPRCPPGTVPPSTP
jgi:hypothetical protein